MSVLKERPQLIVNDALVSQLASLHPRRYDTHIRQPDSHWEHGDHQSHALIVANDIDMRLKKCKSNRSSGLTGWTKELFETIWANEESRHIIAEIVCRITLDTMPDNIQDFLGTGILVPLRKSDNGVRPVVLNDWWLQLAFGVAMLHLPQIPTANSVGLAIDVQKHLDSGGVILKVDATNAFNSISRAAIAREVFASYHFRPLWSLFRRFYITHTKMSLYSRDGSLFAQFSSEEGVRQGAVEVPVRTRKYPDVFCVAVLSFVE